MKDQKNKKKQENKALHDDIEGLDANSRGAESGKDGSPGARVAQKNYDAHFSQQGNQKGGSNGRGYNEVNGGRNDQYEKDKYTATSNPRPEEDNDNGYNSFDQHADRGNDSPGKKGGGGYGSTDNRYEKGSPTGKQPKKADEKADD